MKLYTVVGSPNSRKVEAVINHLGDRLGGAVEREYLDFFTGDLRQPAYLALNPNGMVPTLVDGDLALWETTAIMQYLADKAAAAGGSDALFPRDPRKRAEVVRWQAWDIAHYNRAFGVIAFETVAKSRFGLGPANMALAEEMKKSFARFAPVLDAHLEGRQYVAGDGITLADYSLIHLEGFKEAIAFDWSPYPNLNAYYERMRSNEHWVKTAPPSREAIGRRPAKAA
jgi:glutathione S-transferase